MRRLPGPAVCRLSEGANTPEALYELFRDWQRTPTQSSATALVARGSQWMSGSAKSRNHPPRGTSAHDDTCHHALRVLANAPGTSLPPLTEDSHGCRQTGHFDSKPRKFRFAGDTSFQGPRRACSRSPKFLAIRQNLFSYGGGIVDIEDRLHSFEFQYFSCAVDDDSIVARIRGA